MTPTLAEIICSWPSEVPFCARTAASQCSSLISNDQLFELAIEECLDAIDRTNSLEVAPFLQRFPEIADRLLPALNAIPQAIDPGWPRIGDTIDDHKIVQCIGFGKTSRVYLAEDGKTGGRATVLKFTANPSNESVYLARLNHPSLPTLYHVAKDAKYISLQHVNGLNAKAFLNSHAATLAEKSKSSNGRRGGYYLRTVVAMDCIASAIDHIHSRGVAHNDIKPTNIIISDSQALLIDFDAASEIGTHGTRRSIGTVDYLSNESLEELARNGQLVSQNCVHDDHFAFAVTCFEMLTGNLPWQLHLDEVTPECCKDLIEKRKSLSIDSVLFKMMPPTLAQDFVRIFSSATRPPTPTRLMRTIAYQYGVAPRHRFRTAIGVSTATALLFTLLIVMLLPFGDQKKLEPTIEASSVFASTSPPSSATQQSVGASSQYIEGRIAHRDFQSMSAIDESKLTSNEAARLAYAMFLVKPNHESQVRLYAIAIAKGEANAAIWNNYGFSLTCLRRPADARKAFQAAIQLDPNLLQPYLHLAQLDDVCLGKTGTASIGESAFAALQRSPNEPTVRGLAVSALKALGSQNDGKQASLETAHRLLKLLSETRRLPLTQPIMVSVNPFPVTPGGGPDIARR